MVEFLKMVSNQYNILCLTGILFDLVAEGLEIFTTGMILGVLFIILNCASLIWLQFNFARAMQK
jgi:hypothetical protein